MIKVYVRESDDLKGVLLGEFEPVYLPQLVQKFSDYETYLDDTGDLAKGDASGQWVLGKNEVYFEIVVFIPEHQAA